MCDIHSASRSFVQIVDRSKDVVKSGGEFLSSVALENEAMGVGTLAGAACIGVPDERWGERPVIIAVVSPGQTVTEESVLAHLRGRLPKWGVPDRGAWPRYGYRSLLAC